MLQPKEVAEALEREATHTDTVTGDGTNYVAEFYKSRDIDELEVLHIATVEAAHTGLQLATTPPGEGRHLAILAPMFTMGFQVGYELAMRRYHSDRPE